MAVAGFSSSDAIVLHRVTQSNFSRVKQTQDQGVLGRALEAPIVVPQTVGPARKAGRARRHHP